MVEIIDRLYLGSDEDVAKAKQRDMTICAMCKEGPDGHRTHLGYKTLGAPQGKNYLTVESAKHLAVNVIDADDPNWIPEAGINAALKFIDKHRADGETVLVHCNMGLSRGPTTMLMYLRSIGEMPHSFVKAEKIFRTLYPKYDPGMGMRQYARSHWSALEGVNA